jgi:hypothetical protein
MDSNVKENNVRQTNLRQADAKVTVAGIVSDKKLEMKTENGVRTIEGTITIKTSDTNFVQMRVRCADKKKDGTENKTFTGVMTVMNEYKSIADNGADEADRVRTSGQINLFRNNNNGNEIVSYTSNFFNRIKPNQDYEPKAEFEVEMYIKTLVPEINKDGEETGRYKIVGWIPTFNGIEPLELFVPEELADVVSNTYEPKQTARFYGEIVQNVTYETIERPMAFGVKKETKANFINELVVTGGSPAYNAETEEEIVKGGNQIPYNPDTIQAAIEERDRRIKEEQNKPKTNTANNTKPSGASRGRQLGW